MGNSNSMRLKRPLESDFPTTDGVKKHKSSDFDEILVENTSEPKTLSN